MKYQQNLHNQQKCHWFLFYRNGAQFLKATCVASLLGVAILFPVSKISALERLDSNEFVKTFIGSLCE